MCDFLAEYGNQRFFEGIDETTSGIEGEIEYTGCHQGVGAESAADKAVNDILQDERRCNAHGDGCDDSQDEDQQEQAVLP